MAEDEITMEETIIEGWFTHTFTLSFLGNRHRKKPPYEGIYKSINTELDILEINESLPKKLKNRKFTILQHFCVKWTITYKWDREK